MLDDLEQNNERLNILNAISHLNKPLLIIHGTADVPVKIEEANKMYDVADKNLTEFITLEGASHLYGAKHPYTSEGETMTHVLELTSTWIKKQLTHLED